MDDNVSKAKLAALSMLDYGIASASSSVKLIESLVKQLGDLPESQAREVFSLMTRLGALIGELTVIHIPPSNGKG